MPTFGVNAKLWFWSKCKSLGLGFRVLEQMPNFGARAREMMESTILRVKAKVMSQQMCCHEHWHPVRPDMPCRHVRLWLVTPRRPVTLLAPFLAWHIIGRWTRDLLSGINFMHDRDPCIIHRDLKPANLVLVPDLSQLKILDFGVGKMVRSALTLNPRGPKP
jgi:hypothetical protein